MIERLLARQFRNAIDAAKASGEFEKDILFRRYPYGCCGDTCELLAQYLLTHGIRSLYVCGNYGDSFETSGTHAWLLTDNDLIVDITGDQFMNYNGPLCQDTSLKI